MVLNRTVEHTIAAKVTQHMETLVKQLKKHSKKVLNSIKSVSLACNHRGTTLSAMQHFCQMVLCRNIRGAPFSSDFKYVIPLSYVCCEWKFTTMAKAKSLVCFF